MNTSKWKTYLPWILLTEAVGLIAGILTRKGVMLFSSEAIQPAFSPPGFLFPIVWTILYALMGISAARVSMTEPSPERSLGLNLFIIQLAVNFLWPVFFFNLQAYGFAALWLSLLWILVVMMAYIFRKTDPTSAYLQIPYILWLSFALYLNIGVWLLNK